MMLCNDVTGVRTVPIVSECKCQSGCYRLPHYQQVTVYGHSSSEPMEDGGEREGGGESGDSGDTVGVVGQGDLEPHHVMVDVGKCAGRCPQPEQQCIP